MGPGGFMRWMIRGCEFFFSFNLEGGGGEVDVLFTMFLIRKDTNKCLSEFFLYK